MASPAKIAANRRNARRSTGPRSAAGKARARHNAFRHGLATPANIDHVAMDRIEDLVFALTDDLPDQLEHELAPLAAEAQSEIERVRQAKVTLINRTSAHLRDEGGRLLPAEERAATAFAGKTVILMACERYERRAISRRNRALQALAKVQRELRRKEAIERVGPPRPKPPRSQRIPFRDEDVLRLEVERVMRSSPPLERADFSCRYGWEPSKNVVGVHVTTDGNHSFLRLHFHVNGEPVAQTFALTGTAMRVGGVRWTVKCPESGKMVRDLYLLLRPNRTHFRSRHALGLSYRSSYLKPKERYGERAERLMARLGVHHWREKPPRPKTCSGGRLKGYGTNSRKPGGAICSRASDGRWMMSSGTAKLTNIDLHRRHRSVASRRINECRRERTSPWPADVRNALDRPAVEKSMHEPNEQSTKFEGCPERSETADSRRNLGYGKGSGLRPPERVPRIRRATGAATTDCEWQRQRP